MKRKSCSLLMLIAFLFPCPELIAIEQLGAKEKIPKKVAPSTLTVPDNYDFKTVAEYPVVQNPFRIRIGESGEIWILEKTIGPEGLGKRKTRLDRITLLSTPDAQGKLTRAAPKWELANAQDFRLLGQWLYALGNGQLERKKIVGNENPPPEVVFTTSQEAVMQGFSVNMDKRLHLFTRAPSESGLTNILAQKNRVGKEWAPSASGLAFPIDEIFHSRDGRKWVLDRVQTSAGWETRLFEFFPGANYAQGLKQEQGLPETTLKPTFKCQGKAGMPCFSSNPQIIGSQGEALLVPFPENGTVQAWFLPSEEAMEKPINTKVVLRSNDPAFSPTQIASGPNGSFYLISKGFRGEKEYLSHAPVGKVFSLIALKKENPVGNLGTVEWEPLVNLLSSKNDSLAFASLAEITSRFEKDRTFALKVLANDDEATWPRLLALYSMDGEWNKQIQDASLKAFDSGISFLQTETADFLTRNSNLKNDTVFNGLLAGLADERPAVRSAVIRALGKINAPGTAEILVNSFLFYEGQNPIVLQSFQLALAETKQEGLERLLAVGDSGVKKDLQKVVELQAALGTPLSAGSVPAWLANPNLSNSQKEILLKSLNRLPTISPQDKEKILKVVVGWEENTPDLILAITEVLPILVDGENNWVNQFLLRGLRSSDPSLRVATLNALGQQLNDKLSAQLGELLKEKTLGQDELLAVFSAASRTKKQEFLPGLSDWALGENPTNTRIKAFSAIKIISLEAANSLAKVWVESPNKQLSVAAVNTLLENPQGTISLGRKIIEGQVTADYFPLVMEAGQRQIDANSGLPKLFKDLFDWKLKQKVEEKTGDEQNGFSIFLGMRRETCLGCHRINGVGAALGPDLTNCANLSQKKIIEALLFPDLEIAQAFQATTALNKSGALITGIPLRANEKTLVLREPSLIETVVPKVEIAKISKSAKSLMPEFNHGQLTWSQVLDLAAFLQKKPSQKTLMGNVLSASLSLPLANENRKKDILIFSTPSGFLDFDNELNDGKGNFSIRFFVKSNKEKAVPIEVVADFPFSFALNGQEGKKWQGNLQPYPSEFSQVNFKKGWNECVVNFTYAKGRNTLKIKLHEDDLIVSPLPQDMPQ